MILLGDIEDGLVQTLTPLLIEQGGPFRTLLASAALRLDETLQETRNLPSPSCLVVMVDVQHSPLRPGKHFDSTFVPSLLLTARSFRGRRAAARGDQEQVGVYDLLAVTRAALLGRVLFGPQAGEMHLLRERLLVTTPTQVTWAQEWTVTFYH